VSYTIPLFDVDFGEAEVRAVADTVASGWISMGRNVRRFEEEMSRRLGGVHVAAVSSCTAALHLAMVVSGIGPGDEVIVPSITFVATANAVRYVGATPVFADISGPEDPTLDPEDVRRKLTDRTRALVPVHYAGFPCQMEPLLALAREAGLVVIEDAAHAIDVPWGGRKLGTLGDLGCFSLFANKVITSAEGGFVTTRDPEVAERLRLLRSHGMTTVSWDRAKGHATSYDVVEVGYNYRMDDIRAALALAQLDRLDGILERRARLRARYCELLSDVPGLVVPFEEHDGPSANYIFPVVLEEGGTARREQVREQLKDAGIQTSVHYPAIHRFETYRTGASLPRSEAFADREITLPLYDRLSNEEVTTVVRVVTKAVDGGSAR